MIGFQFTWREKNKYNSIERHNIVRLSQEIPDIKRAAEVATDLFIKSFGSLKKNEIISIYPLNKEGEPFGEAITVSK